MNKVAALILIAASLVLVGCEGPQANTTVKAPPTDQPAPTAKPGGSAAAFSETEFSKLHGNDWVGSKMKKDGK